MRDHVLTVLRELIETSTDDGYEIIATTDPSDPFRERALRLLSDEIRAAQDLLTALQVTDTFLHEPEGA
jgi:hypothetical protein